MGSRSISLGLNGEISQLVTGLEPNCQYEYACFLRVDRGEQAIIGVVNSKGHKEFSPDMENNSPGWNRVIIIFYTMKNQTEAKVFEKRLTSGKGNVYVDDCGLILVGEL